MTDYLYNWGEVAINTSCVSAVEQVIMYYIPPPLETVVINGLCHTVSVVILTQ